MKPVLARESNSAFSRVVPWDERRVRLALHAFLSVTLLLLALWLLVRRAWSGFQAPSGLALLGLGVLLVLFAQAGRRLAGSAVAYGSSSAQVLAVSLPIALLLIGVSCTVSGASAWGVAGLWVLLLTGLRHSLSDIQAQFTRWLQTQENRRVGSLDSSPQDGRPIDVRSSSDAAEAMADAESVVESVVESAGDEGGGWQIHASHEGLASHLQQHWERGTDASGADYCAGSVRVPFAAGQRIAHWHVVMHPPFEQIPEVELELLDDSEAQLALGTVLPHGWRIDLRLDEVADEARTVEVGFLARTIRP